MKQNGPGRSCILHRPFTHSPKHGYCSVLKFCDVEEGPLFYCETLSLYTAWNLQPEITELGCRRERERDATIYTQKGPRHDNGDHCSGWCVTVGHVQWKRHVNATAQIMVSASTQTILPVLSLPDIKQKVHASLFQHTVMLTDEITSVNKEFKSRMLPSLKMFMKCCSLKCFKWFRATGLPQPVCMFIFWNCFQLSLMLWDSVIDGNPSP